MKDSIESMLFVPSIETTKKYIQSLPDKLLQGVLDSEYSRIQLFMPKSKEALLSLFKTLNGEQQLVFKNSFKRCFENVPDEKNDFLKYLRDLHDKQIKRFYNFSIEEYKMSTPKSISEYREQFDLGKTAESISLALDRVLIGFRHIIYFNQKNSPVRQSLVVDKTGFFTREILKEISDYISLEDSSKNNGEFYKMLSGEFYSWASTNPNYRKDCGIRYVVESENELFLRAFEKENEGKPEFSQLNKKRRIYI